MEENHSPTESTAVATGSGAPADAAASDIDDGASRLEGEPPNQNEGVPEIRVNLRVLPVVTKEAWEALTRVNRRWPHLFVRGGQLVRLQRHDGAVVSQELTALRLNHTLGRVAHWYSAKNGRRIPALPPRFVVDDMLADPAPPLPPLERITDVPVFGPSGNLVVEPGYHREARTYYAPADDFNLPTVPSAPTPTDVQLARALITEDLLGDFPFTGEAELAHAVGAALLPFVRSLVIGPTPLHLIEKPSPGTGAGLLAEVLCYPAIGRDLPPRVEPVLMRELGS